MDAAPEQPQFVWTCQKCGRKLPTRLDICRCGTRRAAGSPEEPVPVAEPGRAPAAGSPEQQALRTERPPVPPSSGVLNWVVLLAVATIAIGAIVAIQVVPARKPPA